VLDIEDELAILEDVRLYADAGELNEDEGDAIVLEERLGNFIVRRL
jgi:hypothetical protein